MRMMGTKTRRSRCILPVTTTTRLIHDIHITTIIYYSLPHTIQRYQEEMREDKTEREETEPQKTKTTVLFYCILFCNIFDIHTHTHIHTHTPLRIIMLPCHERRTKQRRKKHSMTFQQKRVNNIMRVISHCKLGNTLWKALTVVLCYNTHYVLLFILTHNSLSSIIFIFRFYYSIHF